MQLSGLRPAQQPIPQADLDAAQIHAKFQQRRTERIDFDYRWAVAYDWYKYRCSNFYIPGDPGYSGRIVNRNYVYKSEGQRYRPLHVFPHAIDLVISKQMRARPVPTTKPGPNPRNRLQARAARSLLQHLFHVNQLSKKRRGLLLSRSLTGNAFIKVGWDPKAAIGPFQDKLVVCPMCSGSGLLPVPPEAQQQQQELATFAAGLGMPPPTQPKCPTCAGAKQLNQGRQPLGEVTIKVVPSWEVYPLRPTGTVDDGVYHSFCITKEQAKATYGDNPAFDEQNLKTYAEWRDGKSYFEQQTELRFVAESDPDQVRVIEIHEPPPPGTEHPLLTVVVGNQIIRPRSPVAEPYRRVPWFQFSLRPINNQFFAETFALAMIDANDCLNRSRGNFERHEALMAVAKWMVQMGSVNKKALTNRVAEVVDYSGEKPFLQSGAPMPDWLFRRYEDEHNNIYNLGGTNDIDRGIPPPNVEAHSALFFLAEQSGQIDGPVLVDDEATWAEVFTTAFVCASTNYGNDDQRWVDIVGNPRLLEIPAIKEPDIVQRLGITCEVGNALTQSLALRQAAVTEAEKSGLFTRAGVAGKKVLELMEFGSVLGEDHGDWQQQDELAQQENQLLAEQGYMHTATSMHDHDVHIACHRVAAAEAQARGDPALAMALTYAIDAHVMAKARETAMAAGAVAAPMGDPASASPPPGGAPPFDSVNGLGQDQNQDFGSAPTPV